MDEKLAEWINLLMQIRCAAQAVVMVSPREHPDLRDARVKTKTFEIWRFSKSLVLYPDGYKTVPTEEFKGFDGTIPNLQQELSEREAGGVLGEWLKAHKDSKIVLLHLGDPYWKAVCQISCGMSMDNISREDLGRIFNLDSGASEDQAVEYPRRVRDFLDNLTPEEEAKILDFIAAGGLKK